MINNKASVPAVNTTNCADKSKWALYEEFCEFSD